MNRCGHEFSCRILRECEYLLKMYMLYVCVFIVNCALSLKSNLKKKPQIQVMKGVCVCVCFKG